MKRRLTWYPALAAVVVAGFSGCGPVSETKERGEVGPSAVTAPADYVHAGFQAGEKAKATVGLMALNKAVSAYQSQNGSLPASLEQLRAEGLVPEIPPAPHGQKYHYNPQTGEVTLVAK